MKNLIGTSVLFALLLVGGPAFAAQVSFGIRIGPPPPPRVVRVVPPSPGPGFFWIEGYWYPVGRHYKWHEGYWTRPPYPGARWVAPHRESDEFFEGYWEGDRGRVEHDHHWDRERDRDGGRDRDREHDRDDNH